jgi:hypothetical protein
VAIASSSDAETHEWDEYQSGIFTHEVLSGLRGAADVNRDGRVEYSELAAFLGSANREVIDPRARLHSIVKPPASSAHVSLTAVPRARTSARLTAIPASAGSFFVEDERGNRLIDGRVEAGFSMSVALPSARTLFVRNPQFEAEVALKAGEEKPFLALQFRRRASRPRGAIERSLRSGLFAAPYGPAYYAGYIDRNDGVGVTLAPFQVPVDLAARSRRSGPSPAQWALIGGAGAFTVTGIVAGGFALSARSDFDGTTFERQAHEDRERFERDAAVSIGCFASAAVLAGVTAIVGAVE